MNLTTMSIDNLMDYLLNDDLGSPVKRESVETVESVETIETVETVEETTEEPTKEVDIIKEQTANTETVESTDYFTEEKIDFSVPKKIEGVKVKNLMVTRSKFPYNALTGTIYQGGNVTDLKQAMKQRNSDDPRFLTWCQLKECNLFVKKGAKSIPLAYYNKKKVLDKDTKEEKMILVRNYFKVFHASDIRGMPDLQ